MLSRKKSGLVYVGIAALFVVSTLVVFAPVSGAPLPQDPGSTVTVTGWVTQYTDNDEGIFTDGQNQIKIEREGDKHINEMPLNTPLKVTGRVESDDGKLELKVISFEPASQAAPKEGEKPAEGAQQQGQITITKVSSVLANPQNDQWVALQGQVTSKVDNDEFMFKDDSGEIKLETEGGLQLPVGETITVYGRVDRDDGKVEVDVKGYLKADGTPGGSVGAPAQAPKPKGDDDDDDDDDD
jgi:uncharacterized protein (TIGR00156 family)